MVTVKLVTHQIRLACVSIVNCSFLVTRNSHIRHCIFSFCMSIVFIGITLLFHTHPTPLKDTGHIRSAIGLAHLLMNQRFKQFSGLIKDCESEKTPKGKTVVTEYQVNLMTWLTTTPMHFYTLYFFFLHLVPDSCCSCLLFYFLSSPTLSPSPHTVTPDDLRGFWEMVQIQVDDVYTKFAHLKSIELNQ